METQIDMHRRHYSEIADFVWQLAIRQDETIPTREVLNKVNALFDAHYKEREAARNEHISRLEQGIAV